MLAVDTMQMSVIAIAVATLGAVLVAGVAARPAGRLRPARRIAGSVVRVGLLLLRAVPPPVPPSGSQGSPSVAR